MKPMQGLARFLLCLALVAGGVTMSDGEAFAGMSAKVGIEKTGSGDLINPGDLVVDGTEDESESSVVYGMYAYELDGNVSNTGEVDATTSGYELDSEWATASGIHALTVSGDISNSGTINAAAEANNSEATGIYAERTGSIENTGSITTSAMSYYSDSIGILAFDTDGDITNEGSISAYASSEEDMLAAGIYAISTYGDVRNTATGSIEARTESGEDAESFGIYAEGAEDVINAGTISASAMSWDDARSMGIYGAYADSVQNSGSVSAEAYSSDEDAYAYGIQSTFVYETENSGTVVAEAEAYDAYAFGISAFSPIRERAFEVLQIDDEYFPAPSILNSGTIQAFSNGVYTVAAGIWSPYALDVLNTSTGTIEAEAQGRQAMAAGIAVGVEDGGMDEGDDDDFQLVSLDFIEYGYGSVSNEGSVTVTASGEFAQAVGIMGAEVEDIDNSGTITVTATTDGGDILIPSGDEIAIQSKGPSGMAVAIGMAGMGIYGDLTNSGVINVSTGESYGSGVGIMAEYGYSYGYKELATLEDIEEEPYPFQRIVNTGTITVDSFEGAGIAVGEGEWDVYNPGTIYTSNYVRTLYVGESYFFGPARATAFNGGPDSYARLVDDFRIVFNGVPYDETQQQVMIEGPEEDIYIPQIYVGYDGYLDLNDATLIAQAGETIVWNTPYRVIQSEQMFLLKQIDEEPLSSVEGNFGDLQSANPNITVSWWDEEETGENSAVVFEYTPQASAQAGGMRLANMGAIQGSNLIQQRSFSQVLAQHIKQQETLLADSGQTASASSFLVAKSGQNLESAVFFRTYLKTINREEEAGMGYKGALLGMIIGYERMISSELTMGLHGGFGLGNLDYEGAGFEANKENLTIYSLGVHGAYNPEAWHFDGSATLYAANHKYDGLTGGALEYDENDDYMSYGAEVEAIGGYVFSSGQWAAMPYLGLGYSWVNAPSHTTDADNPAWDTSYGSVDEHILRSILGAQVSANWLVGETKVVPTAGLRWEYALTDNDIAVSQSLLGSPSVTVKDDIARSSLIGDLSIAFSKDAASLEFGAMGQYNDDFSALGGWMTLKYAF